MPKMDEESQNWFRVSKLIIDVGADVLRKLVVETSKTPFLNTLAYDWLTKVKEMQEHNHVATLWFHLSKDINQNKDETCKRSLNRIYRSWKVPNQKLTLSDQVHTLEKLKVHIEKSLSSSTTNVNDTLGCWLTQIQDKINNLKSMPIILNTWSVRFLELCQQSRQDQFRIFEANYAAYDGFISSIRGKISKWSYLSKEVLKENITKFESDRKKSLETWKIESQRYFKSVEENFKDLFTSWNKDFPDITNIRELKALLDYFKTKTSEIDETKVQKSCDTWYEELHYLFDKWLIEIDESDVDSLQRNCMRELKCFPTISSQHVKDLINSTIHKKEKLEKKLSKEQYSNLYTSDGFPDLDVCDTSLLFIVLKTFLVYPPMHGWIEIPPNLDQSLGADILRLKNFRNSIIAHIEKTKINQRDFGNLWLNVKHVLCRLASHVGHKFETDISEAVDLFRTCPLDPKKESELHRILEWCKNDILTELKGIAKLRECVQMLDTIEKVECERLSGKQESSASDNDKSQHDEESSESDSDELPTTIRQGLSVGWKKGSRNGSTVDGVIVAMTGAGIGFLNGLGQTIFKK